MKWKRADCVKIKKKKPWTNICFPGTSRIAHIDMLTENHIHFSLDFDEKTIDAFTSGRLFASKKRKHCHRKGTQLLVQHLTISF